MYELNHDQNQLRKSARSRSRRALYNAVFEELEKRQLLSGALLSIAATDATATEATGNTGTFRLTRDDTSGALDVTVSIDGTATNGTDYSTIATKVSFADGKATADVTVTTKQDTTYEGSETVIVTVEDGDDYDVDGDNDSATVTITDDEKPTISIDASDDEADEADDEDTGTFTISRDGTEGALTVKLTIAGTATNGTDYETIATTATILDGEESVDVDLTTKTDSTLEGTETVKVTIAADATKYNISKTDSSATVNILDDELSTVKIAASDATATEGSTTDTGKFTITRTGTGTALADALVVKFAVTGSATDGTDYDTIGTTATIPAGKATVDVTVKTKNDTDVELTETTKVTLTADDAYLVDSAGKSATVNVKDDDKPVVTIEASDATAAETGLNNTGKFKISRTGATTETLTVGVTLAGTATKGTDYKTPASSVTIPVGKAYSYIEIKPKDDLALEGTETVIMNLAAGSTYTVGSTKTATVNLTEDEVPDVSIKATDAIAIEPGTDKGTFTITRTGPTTAALVVDLDIDGTADAEDDYTEFDDSVTIAVGKSSATISIVAKDDTDLEGSETVIVGLAASDDYDTDATADEATVTIKDNEKSTVTIAATDSAAAEASSNIGKYTITRTGSGAAIVDEMKVSFSIAGTATKGTDYASIDTTVTIPAGVATKTITVTPVDDSTVELNETVILTLAANAAYTVGTDKSATVTITENDKPTVTLVGTDTKAAEPSDKASITISRNGPTTEDLEVAYVIDEDSSATNGTDYDTLTGTATIPAGKASVVVSIATKDDTDLEGSENILIALDADDAYLVDGDKNDTEITIADNEKSTVTMTLTDDKADENGTSEEEDSAGTAKMKFSRTGSGGAITDALDVLYTITGTAKTGTDTTETLTGKVTIAAGQNDKTITITGKNDTDFEGDETIIVTLKAAATYTVGTDKTGTVTVVEDDKPTVSISSKDLTAKEGTTDTIALVVTRTGITKSALTVNLTTSGDAGSADFTSLPTTVTIPAGKQFVSVSLTAKDDSTYEGTETANFILGSSDDYDVDEDASQVTGTITDKQVPTVGVDATDAAADEDGHATGTFTFTRSGPTTDPVVVNYTISGTAKNGKDYNKIAKTVTIEAGEESATVTITPKTDTAVEGSETAILTLAKGDYTIDEDATTDTVTIADEQSPTISIEAIDSPVAEASTIGARFRIWRDGIVSGVALDVDFELDGTAAIDDDYTIEDEDGNDVSDGHVTIAAGEAYVDVYVMPVDNSTDASDKTVIMTLSTKSTYTVNEDATDATITIADDDEAPGPLPKKK